MHNKGTLRAGIAERLQGILVVDGVVVGGKEGIVVTDGLGCTRNLNTGDDCKAIASCCRLGQTHGVVQVGLDAVSVGLARADDICIVCLCSLG